MSIILRRRPSLFFMFPPLKPLSPVFHVPSAQTPLTCNIMHACSPFATSASTLDKNESKTSAWIIRMSMVTAVGSIE